MLTDMSGEPTQNEYIARQVKVFSSQSYLSVYFFLHSTLVQQKIYAPKRNLRCKVPKFAAKVIPYTFNAQMSIFLEDTLKNIDTPWRTSIFAISQTRTDLSEVRDIVY